jgi:hypothetical protein
MDQLLQFMVAIAECRWETAGGWRRDGDAADSCSAETRNAAMIGVIKLSSASRQNGV